MARSPGHRGQAVKIAERCPELAAADEKVWHAALIALGVAVEGVAGRDGELRDRLEDSVELPVVIAEAGADVAELAATAARLGEGTFRSTRFRRRSSPMRASAWRVTSWR